MKIVGIYLPNGPLTEKKLDSKTTVLKTIKLLEKTHSDAQTALHYSNPLELLVATMLSAQCTDEMVNIVTKKLFKKYKTPEDYTDADQKELEGYIRTTGFYRNKARNLKRCCQMLVERFDSQVPRTMGEMLELPGVARKTANIVLSNAYCVVEGIAVDTHVRRLAKRLGFTKSDDPNVIEEELMKVVPKDYWMRITDLLIFHGRRICQAKKPKCDICVLNKTCPFALRFN